MSSTNDYSSPEILLPSDDALIGRVIAGKYRLREVIGVGAAGSVYKADQTSLGRTVAIKVLRPEIACDPRFIRRFHHEATASSRLNHPNVVSVIDFGQTDDGLLYLVMEFLRGVTLTEVLRSEQLSTARTVDIIRQILSALEEAHEGGVVHADLKADNTMVEHRRGGWDLVKVLDFGIARLTGQVDEHSDDSDDSICGTPEYMAPEVIQGQDATPASDIYGVGIMLYELLVGYTPFSGVPTLEVLQRHLNEMPMPPSKREPTTPVPAYLDAVVLKALAKHPADRFADAGEFAAALQPKVPTTVIASGCCHQCGATGSFKFCPECGTPQIESKEFDLDLSDTGHEEIWSDNAKTADLDISDLAHLAAERSDRPPTQEIQSLLDSDVQGELFPIPLLGRTQQIDTLVRFINSGANGVMNLQGARGSGRTRLLIKACQQAVGKEGVVFLAQADPSGQATTFYPIRAIVAAILQLPAAASYEELGDQLDELGLSERDLPGIGELFQHEGAGLWQLEAPIRHREVFASTMRLLRAAGKSYSAVLAFEDCHLYDQPSRELIRRLCESNLRSPSLRIIVTSDGSKHCLMAEAMQLELQPLTEDDLRALVSHFAAQGQPDMVTLTELQANTEGNPGQLAQLLRYAAEGGDLRQCPDTLADLVAARIDFLPQVAIRVLQAAAVFGLSVSEEDLVEALASTVGRIEMDAALKLLSTRNILLQDGNMLQFEHNLVRDVIYESTPHDVRRGLHLAAGDILIASVNDPAILGHHAERAGDLARAGELLARAGDNATRQLDDLGAAALLNRALRATREARQADNDVRSQTHLVEISIKLATALKTIGEVGLARGILNECEDQCADSPPMRVRLYRASARLHAAEGDIPAAIRVFREAIGLAIPIFALELLTETYLDLATMQLRNGESAAATKELEESIDLITMGEGPTTTGGPTQLWRILLRLAQLLASDGDSTKALHMVTHAARLAEANKSQLGIARANVTMASILASTGDTRKAQLYRQKAIQAMRTLGDRRTTAELLLAGSRPSIAVGRIMPASVREARILAEEVGWDEGVRQARNVPTD